jgi:hypothetical protein
METRNCQNCKQSFVIESEDFLFYEKIKVPPPTFCFTCRLQRRMMFRNERAFYKRMNNAPGKSGEFIISIHNPDSPHTVFDDRTWWGDSWDPVDYAKDLDFSRPFFIQFKELYESIPLINLSITNMSDCSYCNVSEGDKGCYMATASNANEDSIYGNRLTRNKDVCDVYIATENESCYEIVNSVKNYKVQYSLYTNECVDSYFLYNCKNCTDCIGCTNLRNKSFYILNQKYSREEYLQKKDALCLNSRKGVESFGLLFDEIVRTSIHRFSHNIRSYNSTGDNLENTSNIKNCFDIYEAENCKNMVWGGYGLRDSMDIGPGIGIQSELLYESFDTALQGSLCLWTGVVYHSFDVRYSVNCHSCSHLFGCHGLRSKQYCILNKQYTKEQYEELVLKIIEHMNTMPYIDAAGRIFRYGEFFPYDISPFAYNETVAQEYFPLSKEEVLQNKWSWYEREHRNYNITLTVDSIPDTVKIVADSICEDIIECANKGLERTGCTTAFKIMKRELDFYRKLGIPLPRLCPNCRHYARLEKRNPLKLWHRSCMCDKSSHEHAGKCEVEFETSYSPDRPEIVYCEKCYQQEVI